MKKAGIIFLLSAMIVLSYQCGSGGENQEQVTKSEVTDITQDPVYQKGIELVAKSDCFTCHKIEEQYTGPSYRDVAKKYAGMPDTMITHLAGKILKGGAGVWGDVFMTPHASLSQEDAEAMVRYILLLKK